MDGLIRNPSEERKASRGDWLAHLDDDAYEDYVTRLYALPHKARESSKIAMEKRIKSALAGKWGW
jgi:hypothetical protein